MPQSYMYSTLHLLRKYKDILIGSEVINDRMPQNYMHPSFTQETRVIRFNLY